MALLYELLKAYKPDELTETTEYSAGPKAQVDLSRVNEPGYLESLSKTEGRLNEPITLKAFVEE